MLSSLYAKLTSAPALVPNVEELRVPREYTLARILQKHFEELATQSGAHFALNFDDDEWSAELVYPKNAPCTDVSSEEITVKGSGTSPVVALKALVFEVWARPGYASHGTVDRIVLPVDWLKEDINR